MFKKFLKKLGFGLLYTIVGLYILFLIAPFVINPFLVKYSDAISAMAEESCGLKIKINKLGIVTTPKLTIGIKISNISAATPKGEEFLSVDNLKAKLSLVPILVGKVEADIFSADNLDAELKVKPDGNLEIMDYLPESDDYETKEQLTELPMGLKLSNKLPNIYIGQYTLSMIDMRDKREYTLQGAKLKVTDFVLNKSIKISTGGIAKLEGSEQFKYDIKIKNHIMPNIDLNDLVFAQTSTSNNSNEKDIEHAKSVSFNIIDVFKGIKQNGFRADANLDIDVSGTFDNMNIKGNCDVEKLSMLIDGNKLPDGHLKLKFKGNKTYTDISLYTAKNELTSIIGELEHGKKPYIDISVKSNAGINNVFKVINTIAKSFNINDLNTLSATGNIDADFNLKSDLKTLNSNGYLKIPSASIKYALYNILIDNIIADVDFNNDTLNINNIGFKILSQPLKLYGKITQNAQADIHLTADKLPVKGLVMAAGQIGLLKENDIKSGTLSMDAYVKGNLKNILPVADIDINNINVLNIPSKTSVKLNTAKLKFMTDGKAYSGDIDMSGMNVLNPAAKFSLPTIKVKLDNKNINIADTYLMIDNSKIDISGKISDYTSKNIAINLLAKGNIYGNDIRSMLPADMRSMVSAKGTMPLLIIISGNDKKQVINAQLLATPNGYFHIADLQSVTGKSLLLTSDINANGETVLLENTAAYATSLNSLSNSPATNISGNKILSVSGSVSDFSNPKFNSLNISTLGNQIISIPTFNNSKATVNANITLNGALTNPELKGNIKLPSVNLPTIKTSLKDTNIDLGKSINTTLPLIMIDNSAMNAQANISSNFSKGIIINSLDFAGNMIDSDTLIAAMAKLPQQSASSSSGSQDLGIVILSGKGSVARFKSGKIIAANLTSDFNLKNNIFTLKNLKGKAFDGNIDGIISCNVMNGKSSVTMTGAGMKAVDAIAASAGISNALSGILGFNAKLTLNAYAPSYNALLKSVKGTANFNVKNGHYMNIGTIDQFVLAGNVVSNTIIKAALVPVKNIPVIKNSSEFSDITGTVDLNDGIATLKPVKSSGKNIAYYVTGKYNLLTGYTNVIILGRMGAEIVAVLGPLGQLSAQKLTSFIPKFGAQTLKILNTLTADPATEQVSKIPALTDSSTTYKDFKVLFLGNITSPTSVKTFKWLSTCDTSAIEASTVKDQVKASIDTIKQTGKNNVEDVKKTVEATKSAAQNTAADIKKQVQKTKESIQELKNLKNMFKLPSSSSTDSSPETPTN